MVYMTTHALTKTLALGAITGMRSMSGPATVATAHLGAMKHVVAAMAAGEMLADKTSLVGDRIDPLPLAGRAVMGAIVGVAIAREAHGHVWLGGLVGASAAVIAAHAAYYLRTRLPVSNTVGGLIEDAIVGSVGAFYASRPQTA
jgi:uncharacterized membrane protein